MLQNHHDAEEIVQDVFLKVYKTIETFRNLPREEIPSLIVIYTKNTALDYLRKKKREVHAAGIHCDNDGAEKKLDIELDIKDNSPEPDEIIIDRERAEQIGAYIDSLPEKQRQVMILRYKYGMSEKSIAKAMSMTETAVSSCVNRAKKKLRKMIAEEK